jgi:mycothiol synthase
MAQTPDMIKVDRESDEYVENGMMILWNEENPVGVISMIKMEENGEYMAWIGPVAVLPEYQGKGLGRILLRAGVRHAADSGLNSSVLVVDAENTRAVNLYLGEGFYEIDASVCYSKKL